MTSVTAGPCDSNKTPWMSSGDYVKRGKAISPYGTAKSMKTTKYRQQQWSQAIGQLLSHPMVNGRLIKQGLWSRRTVKASTFTPCHIALCLKWAQNHQNHPLQDWRIVVSCNESRFVLTRVDR